MNTKITAQNYKQFTPAELDSNLQAGNIDVVSLGLEAAVGLFKLIQTGVDNGPRGRRIRELQESDKRFSALLEVFYKELVAVKNENAELRKMIEQMKT